MKFTAVAISLLFNAAAYHDIVDLHGPLAPHDSMLPWKVRSKVFRPQEYYNMRTPEVCKYPLEIVILQDATASFEDDFLQMKDIQLPALLNELVASYPGSKVGVVSHRDKPLLPYGNVVDYCQKFEAPLTSDLPSLQTLYGKMISTGGADPPENAFGAMHAALQSPTPGWSNDLATKIIVVATDAQPHFSNDTDNIYHLPPYSGTFDEPHAATQCLTQYYPAPEQVRAAVGAREAYVVTLVFDGSYQGNLVLRAWQWFNTYLGQTGPFINTMANDSSDFWAKLKVSLDAIAAIECGSTSTTMMPATTVPTMPATTVPTMPATTVPTMPATTVPASPATTVPALPSTTVPTLPATTVPTMPTMPATTVPTMPATTVPTIPATTVPTLPATTVPTLPATTVPTLPATITPEATFTPVGGIETTVPTMTTIPATTPQVTGEPVITVTGPTISPPGCGCPPCDTDLCDSCGCAEGVLIQLRYRPQKLNLMVEAPSAHP